MRLRLLSAVALIALASAPVLAQTVQPEPPIRRLDRLDRAVRELNAIVRQGAATGRPVIVAPETLPGDLELLRSRLADLEATQQSQNATIETLTGELNTARRNATEAQAQVSALETRLAAAEARLAQAPAAGPEETGAPDQAAEAPADPAAAFARARQQLLEGDYTAAAAGFERFATQFPEEARAKEARYWLGETRYLREDYAGAAEAYAVALRGWPKATWAPDGVVKLASSLASLNRNETACTALGELARRYADAPARVKTQAAAVRTRAKCAA